MKTATKSAIRSTDELWQWAALKRSSDLSSKYPSSRFPLQGSSSMAQGILARLYTILRESCRLRR